MARNSFTPPRTAWLSLRRFSSIVMATYLEEFHPNRIKNVENTGKIWLAPVSGVWFGCTEFHDT